MILFIFKILLNMAVGNENNEIKGGTVWNHRHQNPLKIILYPIKLYISIIRQYLIRYLG
ncbi:MAG: DUF1923 family maltosyltransferase [Chryseobacterium rhizosphaerae]